MLIKPHIEIEFDAKHAILVFNDTELYDFVEDYLLEKHDIRSEYVTQSESGYRLFFDKNRSSDIEKALSKLDDNEIETVWRLNNN
ncbi:hypothetical protein F9K33_16320 [bacterium]|nr:MAG: hypothetical protein F9K33_16320 [bacterium]